MKVNHDVLFTTLQLAQWKKAKNNENAYAICSDKCYGTQY